MAYKDLTPTTTTYLYQVASSAAYCLALEVNHFNFIGEGSLIR